MALKTRRPTGRPAWPLILVEGAEKSGKSWLAAELASSPKVGATYWLDLGEGSADEYLDPADPRHNVIEHDGSFTAIYEAVKEVRDIAAKALANGERPVVLVIDSMTAEWELLSAVADRKARLRKARQAKREISDDETVTIGTDIWNEVNSRHRKLMTLLMTFPGFALITARGKETVKMGRDGSPIPGAKEYKVEGQKTLAYDASVWIRLSREDVPTVVGVRSKREEVRIRPGVDPPRRMRDLALDRLLFDLLGYEAGSADVRDLVNPQVTDEDLADPSSDYVTVLEVAIDQASTEDELRAAHGQIKPALDAGRITKPDADRLYARVQERKPEVAPSRRQEDRSAPPEQVPAAEPITEPAEPTGPEMVTDHQIRHMHAIWSDLGRTQRDQYLADASEVLGEPVDSTRALTREQADRVIDWLKAEQETRRRQRAMDRAEATAKGKRAPETAPPAEPEPERLARATGARRSTASSTSSGAAAGEQRQALLSALAAAGYHKPAEQRGYVAEVLAPAEVKNFRDLSGEQIERVLAALGGSA